MARDQPHLGEQYGSNLPLPSPLSPVLAQDKLDFLHLPIIDGSVTSDVALSRLADDCCTRILRGERLYVHWWVLAHRLACCSPTEMALVPGSSRQSLLHP